MSPKSRLSASFRQAQARRRPVDGDRLCRTAAVEALKNAVRRARGRQDDKRLVLRGDGIAILLADARFVPNGSADGEFRCCGTSLSHRGLRGDDHCRRLEDVRRVAVRHGRSAADIVAAVVPAAVALRC